MKWFQNQLNRPFFIKLLHWEYWSFHAVYLPVYLIWIGLCLRARSFFFFAAANPQIRNGGFLNESKKDICSMIPREVQPKTAFFSIPASGDIVLLELRNLGLSFPLIGKPDVGGRGRGIKALMDETGVREYVRNAYLDFHIQEFVAFKNEVGIFYYRYPGEKKGHLSGIVRKEFLRVVGDGKTTVKGLMMKNKRAILQINNLEKIQGVELEDVLPKGEERVLAPYGNHARGAKFLDDSDWITTDLTATVDALCHKIPDFYFGRLDIRFNSWEELVNGQNFSVIEVNGAGSEPTHMYDPRHSIFFAWKEIIRHWFILWRISRLNHKRGYRYLTLKEGIQMFREDKLHSQKLEAMQF
jgi:hypothetical protein